MKIRILLLEHLIGGWGAERNDYLQREQYFNGGILPFLTDKFDEIVVMQTPDNGDPRNVYTHLVQFTSGVRIDLSLDKQFVVIFQSGFFIHFIKNLYLQYCHQTGI